MVGLLGSGWRGLGKADLLTNIGGADLDMQAGKQVEGGLLAGRVAQDVTAQFGFYLRNAYLRG